MPAASCRWRHKWAKNDGQGNHQRHDAAATRRLPRSPILPARDHRLEHGLRFNATVVNNCGDMQANQCDQHIAQQVLQTRQTTETASSRSENKGSVKVMSSLESRPLAACAVNSPKKPKPRTPPTGCALRRATHRASMHQRAQAKERTGQNAHR